MRNFLPRKGNTRRENPHEQYVPVICCLDFGIMNDLSLSSRVFCTNFSTVNMH